jgi:hypothetical protein
LRLLLLFASLRILRFTLTDTSILKKVRLMVMRSKLVVQAPDFASS